MKAIAAAAAITMCALPQAEEGWVRAYRIAYFTDALQTRSFLNWQQEDKYESNPMFAKMSGDEAFLAVLAVNWVQERLVAGIKDKTIRNVLGWGLAAFQFDVVNGNFRGRVQIRIW